MQEQIHKEFKEKNNTKERESERTVTYHPKFNKELEIRSSYKKTVEQRISQELHEELVVGEAHAVVDPERRTRVWSEGGGVASFT